MVKDVQFVTDAEGRKTAALLPISLYEAFQEFMEDQGLARAALESLAENEPVRSFAEVLAEMRTAGEIDV